MSGDVARAQILVVAKAARLARSSYVQLRVTLAPK
jgi:hypothetical protein